MPPPLPTWGRDTPEIEEFRRRRPNCDVYVDRAVRDGSLMRENDIKAGIPLMMTMMMKQNLAPR
jgi:hypothetical protein